MSLWSDLGNAYRYTVGLRRYWRASLGEADPETLVRGWVAQRETLFLRYVSRVIYGNPHSPYLPLLQAANIDAARLAGLVADHGIEGALRRLYEAGVYVTLGEFKAGQPLERGSVRLEMSPQRFDSPLAAGDVSAATGGTRSRGTRLIVDLDDLLHEIPPRILHLRAHDIAKRPFVMWRPAPPSLASLRVALLNVKAGLPMVRWFSQTRPGLNATSGKSAYLTWATVLGSRLMGQRIPPPEYTPFERAEVVARFLADYTATGQRLHVDTMVSSAVRVAQVARDLALDISGHTFRTGSEPLTEAKAALLRAAGCDVISVYGMLEAGTMAYCCGNPIAADDMHLSSYRLAMLPVARQLPGLSAPIQAIYLTMFAPKNPKVMLNVETGDHGVFVQRQCGCPLERAGLTQHLHTIRSYEKLSSAGMTFMGHDLIDIIDEALPARFGGGPTDYQFVESEVDGETVVRLLVRPELGPLDDVAVVDYVLDELARRSPAGRMQTTIWRDSGMLRIERAQPYLTGVAKVQPLHVVK